MTNYLVKTYDDRGRLVDRFEFAAPDDDDAEEAVETLAGDSRLELWSGKRWLRTWAAEPADVSGIELPLH